MTTVSLLECIKDAHAARVLATEEVEAFDDNDEGFTAANNHRWACEDAYSALIRQMIETDQAAASEVETWDSAYRTLRVRQVAKG